jgi:mono/diheme cytochrome c family protein
MKALICLVPVLFLLFPVVVPEPYEMSFNQVKSESAVTDTVISHPGKILIEQNCYSCHSPEMTGQQRLAPPIQMVKMHYMRDFETKEAFVDAIAEWVSEPSEGKSIMPGAVNRFGLMPPYPISDEDVRLIADYLYDTDLPAVGGHGNGHMRHGRRGGGN